MYSFVLRGNFSIWCFLLNESIVIVLLIVLTQALVTRICISYKISTEANNAFWKINKLLRKASQKKVTYICYIVSEDTLKPSFTYKVRLRFFQDNDTFTNRTIFKVAKALSIYFCFLKKQISAGLNFVDWLSQGLSKRSCYKPPSFIELKVMSQNLFYNRTRNYLTWLENRITVPKPIQLCMEYILGISFALWKLKTVTRPSTVKMNDNAFNDAWIIFIINLSW